MNTVLKNNLELTNLSENNIWKQICAAFIDNFGQSAYENWLKPVSLSTYENGVLTLIAPSRFIRDWVSSNYKKTIINLGKCEDEKFIACEIRCDLTSQEAITSASNFTNVAANTSSVPTVDKKETNILQHYQDSKMRFDNFVVGQENLHAFTAVKKVICENDLFTNPLYIHGDVGVGKTHLMQAACGYANERGLKVLYVSAERFIFEFVKSLRSGDILEFKDRIRSVDVLAFDDIQFLSGKGNILNEFSHTLDYILEAGKTVLISANCKINDLKNFDERLKSRLFGGFSLEIKKPSIELKEKIISFKANSFDIKLSNDVCKYISNNIKGNVREIEGAINRLRLIGETEIKDVAEVRKILADVIDSDSKKLSIDNIKKAVAGYYEIEVAEMDSAKKSRNISIPRQVAMFLCKKLTTYSLPEIGRNFGGKDHSTVVHAVKKIEKDLALDDNKIASALSAITDKLDV